MAPRIVGGIATSCGCYIFAAGSMEAVEGVMYMDAGVTVMHTPPKHINAQFRSATINQTHPQQMILAASARTSRASPTPPPHPPTTRTFSPPIRPILADGPRASGPTRLTWCATYCARCAWPCCPRAAARCSSWPCRCCGVLVEKSRRRRRRPVAPCFIPGARRAKPVAKPDHLVHRRSRVLSMATLASRDRAPFIFIVQL